MVTFALYLFCLLTIAFVRAVYVSVKAYYSPPPKPEVVEKKKRQRKPVRSIQIDPQNVDRIFFKKSS